MAQVTSSQMIQEVDEDYSSLASTNNRVSQMVLHTGPDEQLSNYNRTSAFSQKDHPYLPTKEVITTEGSDEGEPIVEVVE
jgi:hypothetical protein